MSDMTTEQVIAECRRLAPDFKMQRIERVAAHETQGPGENEIGWDSTFTMDGKLYQMGETASTLELAEPICDRLARKALETLQDRLTRSYVYTLLGGNSVMVTRRDAPPCEVMRELIRQPETAASAALRLRDWADRIERAALGAMPAITFFTVDAPVRELDMRRVVR